MDKHLHIVTHDVPWPVAHGGLVDLFYKITALHNRGVHIHLHCFAKKGREQAPELEKYCASVNYYRRKTGIAGFSINKPYIVQSRSSIELVNNLAKDDYPILLDGIHCTALLLSNEFKARQVFVRLHNIEYKYYHQLAKAEKSIFKKIYYTLESRLLKRHERLIASKAIFLAVSDTDATAYNNYFHAQTYFLPVFLPYREITAQPGKGCYCLYHGNLSVNENDKAAQWLLKEVFNNLDIPIVIAGKSPSAYLKKLAESKSSACLVANPTESEMQDLIGKAQIHVLPSFNTTGVKLKLLNALFNGKHCLVNEAAVSGSGADGLCVIADDPATFREETERLYALAFTNVQIQLRKNVLQDIYSNEKNASQLMTWIW